MKRSALGMCLKFLHIFTAMLMGWMIYSLDAPAIHRLNMASIVVSLVIIMDLRNGVAAMDNIKEQQ